MMCSEASNPQHHMLREGQELLPLCALSAPAQQLLLLPLCYYQCSQHHLITAVNSPNKQKSTATFFFLTGIVFCQIRKLNKFCAQLSFATGRREVKVAVSTGYEMICYLTVRG